MSEVHIDDSGLIWAYSDLCIDDPRLEWQVFDGLSWVGVGDIGQSAVSDTGIVDNHYGIWTRSYTQLGHYQLSPPGWAKCTKYIASDFGGDNWPWWSGVDSSGCLWGTQFGSDVSEPPRIYSFDGRELKVYYAPEDFRPSGGAVDRLGNKWFQGWSPDARIGRFDGETWDIWGSEDGLPGQRWSSLRFAFDEQCQPWVLGYIQWSGDSSL